MKLIITVLVTAVALLASTYVVDGIDVTETTWPAKVGTLLVVAAIFGLVNAIVKPLVKTIGCGIYVLTLGLFGLIVNALLFLLVGWFAEQFGLGFEVDGFWAGFWGAIVVWVVSFVLNLALDLAGREDD
ncbi:phage holin family protein [Cryptosporangium japonicum]|uniref:Phage holin family protein n=1 Tax=Cryptosporangium japonicum TaxID=80872 RepID=A0ABN0TDN3_9ACTN